MDADEVDVLDRSDAPAHAPTVTATIK